MSIFSYADDLLLVNPETSQPRDLPGRYGRAIKDLESLLRVTQTLSVVAGGWAVWRYGFAGRVTQGVDIVVPLDRIDELNRFAGTCGFDFLASPQSNDIAKSRWPKMLHRETAIDVDLLPETGIPGTPSKPAPVPIAHPSRYDAVAGSLQYISIAGLIELKLGAARAKDIADIIELIHVHRDQLPTLSAYLAGVHATYGERFEALIRQAQDES